MLTPGMAIFHIFHTVFTEWECPTIEHGEFIVDRNSRFLGHIAPVLHIKQVDTHYTVQTVFAIIVFLTYLV